MRLSDLSIRRPVLATVASLLIIVFGIAAALRLPLRELPDIDTSVITVTTTYVGASPETVDTDITEIIEGDDTLHHRLKELETQRVLKR